jgi:hypothetical protein
MAFVDTSSFIVIDSLDIGVALAIPLCATQIVRYSSPIELILWSFVGD